MIVQDKWKGCGKKLGNSHPEIDNNLQCPWLEVLNNFIKNLFIVKSSDCTVLLSTLHTSTAYSKIGRHFCFSSSSSSEANLPTLVKKYYILHIITFSNKSKNSFFKLSSNQTRGHGFELYKQFSSSTVRCVHLSLLSVLLALLVYGYWLLLILVPSAHLSDRFNV